MCRGEAYLLGTTQLWLVRLRRRRVDIRILQVLEQGPDLDINMAFLTLPVRSAFLFVSLSELNVSCNQDASHVLSSLDLVP